MSRARLAGATIVLTRTEEDSAALSERLSTAGARVIRIPAIRFSMSEDLRDWHQALDRLKNITHLVFTSPRAVEYFLLLCEHAGIPATTWSDCHVSAIGRRTARCLEEAGWPPHLIPSRSTGAELASEMVKVAGVGPGSVVLIPCSSIARPEVADGLETAGATVWSIPVYETRSQDPARAAPLHAALQKGTVIDAVLFASPSAVRGFLDMTADWGRTLLEGKARIVTIGPTTSREVYEKRLDVAVEAGSPGPDGLFAAVLRALER